MITLSISTIFHLLMIIFVMLAMFMPEKNVISAFGYIDDERIFLRLALIVVAALLEMGFWISKFI